MCRGNERRERDIVGEIREGERDSGGNRIRHFIEVMRESERERVGGIDRGEIV